MATTYEFPTAELFRLAVDLSPSGMLAVDGGGSILLVNREVERLFGYERGELLGKPVERLVPERFRGAHDGYRHGFLAQPHTRPMGVGRELFGLRKVGTEFPAEIGLNPVQTTQGLLVLASVVDVTQRRQLEEQLRQSQKLEAIGTLAGGIAHDFNNLLQGIVGFAELAIADAAGNERLTSDLEQILKGADRGRELVQRILTFSRRSPVTHAPVVLERPVRDALRLLRSSLPSTIEIREELDPRTPEVLSDETEVHQVLLNLATNSAHALESRGTIEVRLAPFHMEESARLEHPELRPGLYARLTVADRGRGMTPEVAARAFEPFFTTKPAGTGTGLGLSVIRGIVRSHGGEIELWTRPGEGTRMDVYLPALTGEQDPADPPGQDPPATAGARILLVDDEVALTALQARRIEDMGYRVTAHTSSLQALEAFRREPGRYDLLITDNTMPGLTGSALVREVHALRPDLPVLMVSGLLDVDDLEVLTRLGVGSVLKKPHTGRELEAAIRRALGQEG